MGSPITLAVLVAFILGGAAAQTEERDMAGAIAALPDVARFAAAFEQFAVADSLMDDMTYTVFAPTDGALEEAGAEFMSVEDVLAYIVEGTYLHGDLADLAERDEAEDLVLTSLAGTNILVRIGQPRDVVLDGRAVIALPDTRVDHVTIHTIHGVLGEQIMTQ